MKKGFLLLAIFTIPVLLIWPVSLSVQPDMTIDATSMIKSCNMVIANYEVYQQ